jgi:hypothetical protein
MGQEILKVIPSLGIVEEIFISWDDFFSSHPIPRGALVGNIPLTQDRKEKADSWCWPYIYISVILLTT